MRKFLFLCLAHVQSCVVGRQDGASLHGRADTLAGEGMESRAPLQDIANLPEPQVCPASFMVLALPSSEQCTYASCVWQYL